MDVLYRKKLHILHCISTDKNGFVTFEELLSEKSSREHIFFQVHNAFYDIFKEQIKIELNSAYLTPK